MAQHSALRVGFRSEFDNRLAQGFLLAIAIAILVCGSIRAQIKSQPDEWPGWRGADRTGVSKETGLLKQWPAGGPKLLWKATGLGHGYSTPSVAQGRIYLVGTQGGDDEYLMALSLRDGSVLWRTKIGRMDGGVPGPRSTPTVDGELTYVLSSDGKLVCAGSAKGDVRWTKDLKRDFGGQPGGWAYTESPLVDGDLVLCTPGGDQATMVALRKRTGDVVWKGSVRDLPDASRPNSTAGYSSIIAANVDGMRQYIQFISGGVVGVSARDGKFLWTYRRPANDTANCSTPIFRDNTVFAASNYGVGGGAAKITRDRRGFKADELYFVNEMQNHHGGMVLVGDHIYGTGSNSLLCVDFKSGKIAWQNRSVGKGSIAYADGNLYLRSEHGPVALVEATPQGYRERGQFQQPDRSDQNAWAYPVIAGGRLYLRDWDALFCYDVKAK